MSIGQTIREGQTGWSPEQVAHAQRTAVYAVAMAHQLGREDLSAVRIEAETGGESDAVVRLARWFDAATYPPNSAPLALKEALGRLDELGFEPEMVAAFRAIQPLIQPVGFE